LLSGRASGLLQIREVNVSNDSVIAAVTHSAHYIPEFACPSCHT